jgi:hypothetical protein
LSFGEQQVLQPGRALFGTSSLTMTPGKIESSTFANGGQMLGIPRNRELPTITAQAGYYLSG